MNRTPVKSSNLKSVGYDPKTQELEVEFHSGAVHTYRDVPADKYRTLLLHESPGSYFHFHIKDRHKSKAGG